MKVSRVQTIRKVITEDVNPEEIVDEIIDSVNFYDYEFIEDINERYEAMFEEGFESLEDIEGISEEDFSMLKALTIEKLKETRESMASKELKTFLECPRYIAQLMEYLNEDLQRDFEFINSDTPEVREAIIKYLQEK